MRILGLIAIVLFFSSCGDNKAKDEDFLQSLDSAANADVTVDTEAINSILQQLPSPLEISMMLKESGQEYNQGMLNSASNRSKYNTNFQKAINLGIYGTDLGYTNIYEQNQVGIEYISAIKGLADDLSIGQFFDLETISKLAENSKNIDSLLLITTQNFNKINGYLQSQNRSNLSVLLLTGGWIEAMNITCQLSLESPENQGLKDAIGDQKTVAESLELLMDLYESDPAMDDIRKTMSPLWTEYEKIEITIEEGEKSSEVVDGVLIITDNSSSSINISDENIVNITQRVSDIRNKVIQ